MRMMVFGVGKIHFFDEGVGESVAIALGEYCEPKHDFLDQQGT